MLDLKGTWRPSGPWAQTPIWNLVASTFHPDPIPSIFHLLSQGSVPPHSPTQIICILGMRITEGNMAPSETGVRDSSLCHHNVDWHKFEAQHIHMKI